jgi:hypothetical protein
MKTITLELYSYDELSNEAQERALRDWNEDNNDPFMQSHMINLLTEKLDERGIEYGRAIGEQDPDVRYSLAHCQGDGFMFEGGFKWDGYTVRVKHSGHYYHKYSRTMEIFDADGEEVDPDSKGAQKIMDEYNAICDEMETLGYDHIEWITSEENFREACEANEYTFEANGAMRNA